MQVIETSLPGVVIIEPKVFGDTRGFFFESYNRADFHAAGITSDFVQDNHSLSAKGTLRGLHYQLPHTQAKLCRVITGAVLDIAVDVRRGSAYFGQWISVLLTEENKRQIYVPPGFAHGFVVVSDSAEFLYKCDDFYAPSAEKGVAWDDPDLAIDWQLETYGLNDLVLSAKDKQNPCLADIPPDDLPQYTE